MVVEERSVVVTGGAGFIGSNIVEDLLKENYFVTAIDDMSTGRKDNIAPLLSDRNLNFIEGTILDEKLLRTAFRNKRCVLHQAAIPSVPRSMEDPVTTNEANVTGTLKVLKAAKEASVHKVVMASSSSVYGDTPILPKTETMALNPRSPYAVSKFACEEYCRIFTEAFGLKTACLRYFNVFGPRQDPRSDYAAVIPKFIDAIANGRPLVIYGDGEQTRDFTYVQDVVNANLQAVKSDAVGNYNIACGQRITLNQLAEELMFIMGKRVEVIYADPRPGDVKHSLADISKAKSGFGYRPEFDVHRGLEETVTWYLRSVRGS